MTAKEYLKRAYDIEKRIKFKEQQLLSARDMAAKATGRVTAMRVSGTGSRSKVEEGGTSAVMLEDEIKRGYVELIEVKLEVTRTIAQVKDIRQRTLLEYRYLGYMEWAVIRWTMNYSHTRVMEMHREALQEVENIIKESTQ